MATRNLLVRAGFDASGMTRGTRQANASLRQFGQNANRSMSGLSNSLSAGIGKIGKILARAFAVKALVNFGKQCTELGSDLEEVQNVVDVTFGDMASSINDFASTSIAQFGLSETAAKKYAGVFGSMSMSMGLSRDAALELSKSVTGLTGDVASFYNISNDEAYTKLKSIWTGETESLKELGVVMTQTNLKQYAMSQGITKNIANMTEAEKVMLRYGYVTKALTNASGDFSRNSSSWANQTRILSEQFNALKATIGQGLISALTPVIQVLNTLIGKLRVAAGYFKSFMELIFGKQDTSNGAGMTEVADSMSSVADDADNASDSVGGIGDAAKEAGKKAKGALASFDELNQLSSANSSSSGSGDVSGLSNMGGAVDVDLGEPINETSKLGTMFDGIIKQLITMKDLFVDGFKLSFKTANLDELNKAIGKIKNGFTNVFNDGAILSSFTNMLNAMSLSVGATVGAYASMGVTIATNLLGGIGNYLTQNSQYIKDRLIGAFDAGTEIFNMWSEYSIAFADIFSSFGGEAGQQITANIIGMFGNGFLGILELATKLGRDIMKCIIQPIVDNKGSIKKALEGTLDVISEVTGTFKDLITDTMKKAVEVYDEYLAPAFENIEDAISQIVKALTDSYNTYIQPTLMKMAKSWEDFYNDSLKPVVDKSLEVFGKLVKGVSDIWKETLAPFVSWAIDILAPSLATAFENISEAFKIAGEIILGIVDGLLDTLDGLIDFVVGVFTGDWDKAWQGVKNSLKGIVDTFDAIIKEPIDKALSWIEDSFCRSWQTAWEGAGKVFKSVFDGLKTSAKTPLNFIIDMINKVIRGLNSISIEIPDWVPGVGGSNWGVSIPSIPKLARGGVIDNPTIAMVGEAGKEAVVPLQNNTEWTGEVASLLFNAISPFMGSISSNSTGAPYVIELDSRELARGVIPAIQKEMRRTGVRFT